MNEYIGWDKEHKCMLTENEIRCFYIDDFVNEDKIDFFQYIGKTDINSNKIYADCSIVEFQYKRNHPLEMWDKFTGVFRFNKEGLNYMIDCFNGYKIGYANNIKNIKNLKVIGTLQENKELLTE